MWTFNKWTENTDPNYDLAVIKLDSKLGKKTGILGMTSKIKKDEWLEVSGYPADKPDFMQYKAKDVYYHPNGKKYYGLYDKKGKRIGYIDSRIVTVVK